MLSCWRGGDETRTCEGCEERVSGRLVNAFSREDWILAFCTGSDKPEGALPDRAGSVSMACRTWMSLKRPAATSATGTT